MTTDQISQKCNKKEKNVKQATFTHISPQTRKITNLFTNTENQTVLKTTNTTENHLKPKYRRLTFMTIAVLTN